MRNWFQQLMYGRRGMDELSRFLFWAGLACSLLSFLIALVLAPLAGLFRLMGLIALVFCFVRCFSRNYGQRELENQAFMKLLDKQKRNREAAKSRRSQSKDFRFFKCPNCGTYLRVPKGKGRLHINCKCGYTLYRKT